jgi:Zn-dependent oligopeptidase
MRFHTPIARLVAVAGLLAMCSPAVLAKTHARAAAAKRAPAVAPTVPDNAPFWTGNPTAAQWKARNERRLQLAQAALDRLLAVQGPRTVANTLTLYDEINRQLDMAGTQCGLVEEVSPDSATRATSEEVSQEISKFATDLSLNLQVYDALSAIDLG